VIGSLAGGGGTVTVAVPASRFFAAAERGGDMSERRNSSLALTAGTFAGGFQANSPRQFGQAMVCPANAADVAIERLQNGQSTATRISRYPD